MTTMDKFTTDDECQYCGTEWNPALRFVRRKDIARRYDPTTEERPTCEICFETYTGTAISYGRDALPIHRSMAQIANYLLTEIRRPEDTDGQD